MICFLTSRQIKTKIVYGRVAKYCNTPKIYGKIYILRT